MGEQSMTNPAEETLPVVTVNSSQLYDRLRFK